MSESTTTTTTSTKSVFQKLDASEDSGLGITEVESLCMNCHENVNLNLK